MTVMRLALILLFLGLLMNGCAPRPDYPPPTEPEPAPTPEPQKPAPPERPPDQPEKPAPETEPAPSAPRTAEDASSRAVIALLDQGDQLAASGKHGRAAAAIERALDVEPRNPFVYQRLARLRLKQGQPDQAETLAHKSNSLGGDNPYLRADNWALIAKARRAQGDTVGANSAASRADYLRNRTK